MHALEHHASAALLAAQARMQTIVSEANAHALHADLAEAQACDAANRVAAVAQKRVAQVSLVAREYGAQVDRESLARVQAIEFRAERQEERLAEERASAEAQMAGQLNAFQRSFAEVELDSRGVSEQAARERELQRQLAAERAGRRHAVNETYARAYRDGMRSVSVMNSLADSRPTSQAEETTPLAVCTAGSSALNHAPAAAGGQPPSVRQAASVPSTMMGGSIAARSIPLAHPSVHHVNFHSSPAAPGAGSWFNFEDTWRSLPRRAPAAATPSHAASFISAQDASPEVTHAKPTAVRGQSLPAGTAARDTTDRFLL